MKRKALKIWERWKDETGQATVLFAVSFVVLCTFTALVIDLGTVMLEKQRLQNAIDAAVLAAARELPNTESAEMTADHYLTLNGYTSANATISFENANNIIKITGSKEVLYTFARVIGLTGTTVHPVAAAQKKSLGEVFNYAMFTGSTTTPLTMSGSNFLIDGNVQSNYKFNFTGSNVHITGSVKSVSTLSLNGSNIKIDGTMQGSSISAGGGVTSGAKIYSAASVVPMPEFYSFIKDQAIANGTYYTGDQTFNGNNINVTNSIYVDGNLTVNCSSYTGSGCIVATGNITFNGSGIINNASDAVCFYSKAGNIEIHGSGCTINGILYAPKGAINISASNVTVYGRMISDQISLSGSLYKIISSSSDLDCLPSGTTKLVQ